jgi:hypothetical protein
MESDCRVFGQKKSRRRELSRTIDKRWKMKREGRLIDELDQAKDKLAVDRLDAEIERLMIRIRNRLNGDFAAHFGDQANPSDFFGAEQEENYAATAR